MEILPFVVRQRMPSKMIACGKGSGRKIEGQILRDSFADAQRGKIEKLASFIDASRDDVLAYMPFPREHWPQMASDNSLERVNREVTRRVELTGIFPDDNAMIRLVGAMMLERNDEWVVARRYMSLESIVRITHNLTVGYPPWQPDRRRTYPRGAKRSSYTNLRSTIDRPCCRSSWEAYLVKAKPPSPLSRFPAKIDLTHQDFWKGLPVLQSETAQLRPGRLVYEMLQITGRDMLIFRSRVAPKMASTIVPHPDWMVIMAPVSWLGDYVFDGQVARPFDVFVSGGPDGYSTTNERRHNLALGLRTSRLRDACAKLSGRYIEDIALDDQRIALGQALGTRFHRRILEVISVSLNEPLGPGKFALDAAVENDLFSEIASLIMATTIEESFASKLNLDPLRVVRRAEELFENHAANPPSIADLCKAANVGATTLHLCFNEIYGAPPISYLQAKRVTQARSLILASERVPPSVKDVALSLGFTHSGRFAKLYRSMFGEFPSETLEKR